MINVLAAYYSFIADDREYSDDDAKQLLKTKIIYQFLVSRAVN